MLLIKQKFYLLIGFLFFFLIAISLTAPKPYAQQVPISETPTPRPLYYTPYPISTTPTSAIPTPTIVLPSTSIPTATPRPYYSPNTPTTALPAQTCPDLLSTADTTTQVNIIQSRPSCIPQFVNLLEANPTQYLQAFYQLIQ